MPVYKNKDEKIYKIIVRHIEKHFTSTFQFVWQYVFQFSVEQTYVSTDKFEVLDKNQRQEYPVIHFNSDSFS